MNNRDILFAGSMQMMCSRMISLEIEAAQGRLSNMIKVEAIQTRWHTAIEKLVRAIDDLSDLEEMPSQVLVSCAQRLCEKTWRWLRQGDLPDNVVYLNDATH